MTLQPSGDDRQVAVTTEWLGCMRWDSGYPSIYEDLHAIGALAVHQIGGISQQDISGAAMKAVSRQLLSAVSTHAQVGSFEVRIVAEPQDGSSTRTSLYLIAKARGDGNHPSKVVESALLAAAMCLPRNFKVERVPDAGRLLRLSDGLDLVELQRVEHVTSPQWDYIPSDYFYHIDPLSGDGSGWAGLWHTLARSPSRVVISYLFKPSVLSAEERNTVGSIITDLDLFSHDRTQPNILGYDDFYPGDKNAEVAAKAWHARLDALGPSPLVGRVFVCACLPLAESVAAQLASAIQLSDRPTGDTLRLIDHGHLAPKEEAHVRRTLTDLEVWPVDTMTMWRVEHPPLTLRRFQYLYGPDEAASLCVLPVPDEQGVPGFVLAREDIQRRVTQYEKPFDGPTIPLGTLMHEGRGVGTAVLPLAALNRHSLVVGVQGYGKTTGVLTILAGLWRDHAIPWLVIEPTRPEYRGLLGAPGMEEMRVYSLGRDDISPLRLNPMEPPPGVRCETHRSALMDIFRLAMPLVAPLPELLEQALERCYLMAGWDYDTRFGDGIPSPTLRDLAQAFEECFHEAAYVGEARNVSGAFGVRLKALLAGASGRMLDTAASTGFEDILAHPCVFEMRDLESGEDKALLAALLLHRVRTQATQAGSSRGTLRHVTVIEEAHRILPGDARISDETGEATRARAAEEFVNALAEMRSLGEGFILSTQRPSRLTRAAVGNTNTRLVFHLTDAEDREAMLKDMAACDNDREIAPRLRVGECLGRWFGLDRPEMVRIQAAVGVDTASVPSDEQVASHMETEAAKTRALRPFLLCSSSICAEGCIPGNRSKGRALELRTRASLRSSPLDSDETLTFGDYARALTAMYARQAAGSQPMTYCAAVHSLMERPQDGTLGLTSAEVGERRAALEQGVRASHGSA